MPNSIGLSWASRLTIQGSTFTIGGTAPLSQLPLNHVLLFAQQRNCSQQHVFRQQYTYSSHTQYAVILLQSNHQTGVLTNHKLGAVHLNIAMKGHTYL